MTGKIFKRGETWYYRIPVKDGSRYRTIWKGGFRNKTEALRAKSAAEAERDKGGNVAPSRITVAAYIDAWLRDYGPGLAPATQRSYRSLIERHLKPQLGHYRLGELRAPDIDAAYRRVLAKGISAATISRLHAVLHGSLERAMQRDLLIRNVASQVKPPKVERYQASVPMGNVLHEILRAADDQGCGPILRFIAATGVRQGEARALCWDDVHEGSVSIRGKKRVTSQRSVEIGADTVQLLRQQRRVVMRLRLLMGPAWCEQGLVFPTSIGTVIDSSNFRRDWLNVLKAAGVTERIRPHDLRHANATILLGEGVPLKVVSERLGHGSIRVTGDIYSHVLPGMQSDAARAIERALKPE